MSPSCSHDCGSCNVDCSDRKPQSFLAEPHRMSKIKKVIGIVSGKGGVGKSIVTSMMGVISSRRGYKTAIMDADITGPSIPKSFGLKNHAYGTEDGLLPVETKTGISVMSLNLLVENETDPVVWRGPVISGYVKQFWTDVIWGDIDYMFIDMPPGTGDVPLTIFQSVPVDGIIIVGTPQELVGMIVEKAVNMAKLMNIPVLGLVENMSYLECPDCNKKIDVFGKSKIDELGARYGITNLARIPIRPELANQCDRGLIEAFEGDFLEDMFTSIE